MKVKWRAGGGSMISRRKLLIALGASALTAPLSSFAQQQGKVWRVGFLSQRGRPDSLDSENPGAFRRGMRERGYVEGKNLVIEWRFAEDKIERLPSLAAELVQLKVDVIVTAGTPAIRAAQKATTTIPIVMGNAGDPVGSGFIASLARPGGNITGLSNVAVDISPKLLEMLLSMAPKLSRVALLVNPDNSANVTTVKNVQVAAQRVGAKVLPVQARTPQEIENAFSTMTREHAGAVIVPGDTLFNTYQRKIAELAAKNRLLSISGYWQYAEAGGLMNYAQNMPDQLRRAATYVDKILKGAKPGDLPVEQPMKLELVINRKTAKALGLTIPQALLISADRVIE
jgi:putative ABC transport system substrate-binding protein